MLTATVCRQLPAKERPYKKGDEGGLYLMVAPSGSKHWHMAYRIDGKEKKLSFGPYHDDPERGVTLAEARVKRDAAKKAISQGIDPNAAKKAAKLDQAKMTFGEKADDFLAKQKAEGLGVKSITRTERMIRYLKADFGSRPYNEVARQEFRPELLAFLKRYEKAGKLETVHRLRSTAEQIFDYGDSHGTGINPARNLHKQLIKKKPKSRPALTDSVRVAKLFKTISSPFTGARFDDVVGLGLRFVGYTAARPGEAGALEWPEVDFDQALWAIPPHKVKMRNDPDRKDDPHLVPLSRQAVAILKQVRELTGERQHVFSCSQDEPISDNTLNKRLRNLGYDTKVEHCAHGFRTTFSTLLNLETDENDRQIWDSDAIELQLSHVNSDSTRAIYNRTGPTSLIKQRARMLQHWADRIDTMINGYKVEAIQNHKAARKVGV
jgi:integrase